jgi:hypothetical protein
LGVSAANGTFVITVIDDSDFTLNGTTFSGSYTSGGTVQVGGTVNYQVVSKFGSTTRSLVRLFSVLTTNQAFVNTTLTFQSLVNDTVNVLLSGVADPLEYANGLNDLNDDLGDRYAEVTSRQAFLAPNNSAGAVAILQGSLQSSDQLYAKRYSWINARINLMTGYLILENSSVAARILAQTQLFNSLIQLLTVEAS